LVDLIRSKTDAHVVAGGGAFGVMPEALVKASGVDAAVVGDGEAVFRELLASLEDGADMTRIPGIAWMNHGEAVINPGHTYHALSRCCAADYARWIDVGTYRRRMCAAGVQTKRGCPFACVYCTYPFAEGTSYRLRPAEAVVDGVRFLVRSGIREIEFVDSVFNSPYEHAFSVCEGLSKARTGARLETMEINPRFLDKTLLKAMEEAGFVGIGMTAESASDAVLKGLGKEYGSEHVSAAADVIARGRVPCLWMFLLGGPGETRDTVRDTLRFADERIRPADTVFFNVGIRIYPGTRLEAIARREGVLRLSGDALLDPCFYVSPEVDVEWIYRELDAYLSTHLNALGPRAINLKFMPAIYRACHGIGLRPPLWRRTRQVRRILRAIGVKT
jgi:radical SAM superfamily enzyme YgiQ (UPF0313 family)